MKEYEVVHEIFNECANNQMRDVDFREVSVEDTDAYIRDLEPRAEIEREDLADGGVGSSFTCCMATDTASGPSKGSLPVAASYSTIPSE